MHLRDYKPHEVKTSVFLEIKNAIYKYNNLLSEITALTKKYDDINLLAKLTHILDFTARNYTSSPSDWVQKTFFLNTQLNTTNTIHSYNEKKWYPHRKPL